MSVGSLSRRAEHVLAFARSPRDTKSACYLDHIAAEYPCNMNERKLDVTAGAVAGKGLGADAIG